MIQKGPRVHPRKHCRLGRYRRSQVPSQVPRKGNTVDVAIPHDFLEEQRHAYDIIGMHLQRYLSGGRPPEPLDIVLERER